MLSAEELLAEAQAVDLSAVKESKTLGRSFDRFWPSAIYFRDRGMEWTWIFSHLQGQDAHLTEDRRGAFIAAMSRRYRRHQKQLIQKKR